MKTPWHSSFKTSIGKKVDPHEWNECYYSVNVSFVLAIAEVYFQDGNKQFRGKDFDNSIHFYTEGIKVNSKDNELKAKLYCNRATANLRLGEIFIQFFSLARF